MANFHDNLLAIAADDENMCKVLRRMASNLLACKGEIDGDLHFAAEEIEGSRTAEQIYSAIEKDLSWHYEYIFTGKRSSSGFESEELSHSLARCGENLVFTATYYTAWSSNIEDLDRFFASLPEGDYGVTFFDGDEYDGYEDISYVMGVHHGRKPMSDLDGDTGNMEASELMFVGLNPSEAHAKDIAELAWSIVAKEWYQRHCEFDEFMDDDRELWGYNRPQGSDKRDRPADARLDKIQSRIVDAIVSLPHVVYVSPTMRDDSACERLLPGDRVIVTSEWKERECPKLWVKSTGGATWGICCIDLRGPVRELSCLLPHISPVVDSVAPPKGACPAGLYIRLELEPIDLGAVMGEVAALLRRSFENRTLSTKDGD